MGDIPSTTLSNIPSFVHSSMPSIKSSANPSVYHSVIPTIIPSVVSSTKPRSMPSTNPSKNPNAEASTVPSASPSLIPSDIPSTTLSNIPSFVHSSIPSIKSSAKPSSMPSVSEESIQKCKNKSGKVYMGSIAGLKNCFFLKYLKVVKKEKKCKEENIKTHCYKSCTECNSTLPAEIYSNSPVSSYIPIIKEISAKPSLMLTKNPSRQSNIPSAKPISSMSMSMNLFFFV